MTTTTRVSRILILAWGVVCVAVSLAAQTSTQKRAPQTSGLDRMPIINSSGASLAVIGAADAATPVEAENNSYRNAVYRTATEFTARLFEDARAPLSVSLADLEGYVRRFGRVTGKEVMPLPLKGQMRGFTRLEIHEAFLDPLRIRTMTSSQSKLSENQVEGYLLAPAAGLMKRAATEILIRAVPVRSATVRDGSFQFVFAIRATRGHVTARLERIDVEEDGSPGDATWAFSVTSSDGGGFRIPAQRYNNDRPTVQFSTPETSREVTFSGSRPNLEIRVFGERK